MKLLEKCLGMLYPQTCCFCGQITKTAICPKCHENITYIKDPRCKRCGKPLAIEEQGLCYDCKHYKHFFDQGKSLWLHQGVVRKSIYQFKYHNKRIYAHAYGKELYRMYGHQIRLWEIDSIIPVPLHRKRRRKRGYNQAEVIANVLGKLSGIPVESKAVIRVRYTKPQKELNHEERKQNLEHAFAIKEGWKVPCNVLILDDIYTTGNTIDQIAKLLKEKGAKKVFFLTISIGQGF